jgi:thiol:disulfide interchange protein DsbD
MAGIANAQGQTNDLTTASGPHIQVSLVSEYQQLTTGLNWLGVYLEPEEQWHTYWRNPGDSGEAPKLNWKLPEGVRSGDIEWPIPEEIRVAHLLNYGYDGANLLMVPIYLESTPNTQNTPIEVKVDLSWLVCKEDCIPGWASLSKTFKFSDSPILSSSSNLFTETRKRLPSPERIEARHELTEQNIVVSLATPNNSNWRLLPLASAVIQHNSEQTLVSSNAANDAANDDENNELTIVLAQSDYFTRSEENIEFLLTDGQQGYYLSSAINMTSQSPHSSPHSSQYALWLLALMAFAGGLILNLMPCVLPILSIKALAIQQQNQTFVTKSAYFFGVLSSFLGFAIVIIILKQGGSAIGWGFHMQQPWVVALLAYLFTFIALTLMNIVPSGGRFSGIGQNLIQGQSASSQFFTGVLAVIVASPCTAPFMAAALGVAMVSDSSVTLVIFASLGIGFALPMTLLFAVPSMKKILPKPGMWMENFRQFLAFPIFATVIWLVWIYLQQTNAFAQLWLLSGLLFFCMMIWLAGRSKTSIAIAFNTIALLSVAIVAVPSNEKLNFDEQVQAQAFNLKRLQELRDADQVVLVNMTADWCITCKVNEQVAFSSEKFEQAINAKNVHYMVGDWTNKNEEILKYLNQYQRSGVPLYVVYAGNTNSTVLPQILTTEMVINALELAKGEIKNEI